jgi:hypothetical protein
MPHASRHRAFDAAVVNACQRLVQLPGFRLLLDSEMAEVLLIFRNLHVAEIPAAEALDHTRQFASRMAECIQQDLVLSGPDFGACEAARRPQVASAHPPV